MFCRIYIYIHNIDDINLKYFWAFKFSIYFGVDMYIYILSQKRSNENLLPFDRDFTCLSFFWGLSYNVIYIYAYILVSLDIQSHLISLFGRSGASCHLLIHIFLTYSIDTGNYQTLISKQYTLVTKIIYVHWYNLWKGCVGSLSTFQTSAIWEVRNRQTMQHKFSTPISLTINSLKKGKVDSKVDSTVNKSTQI